MRTTAPLSALTLLALLFLVTGAPLPAADDSVGPLDYSGWKFSEAMADLVKRCKVNLVGDLPDQKVLCARIPAGTFWEEALHFLAGTARRKISKEGAAWVIRHRQAPEEWDKPFAVCKSCSCRPKETIVPILRRLVLPGMGVWVPPGLNRIVLHGTKSVVDEMKRTMATVDVPVQELRTEWRLEDSRNSQPIASWTASTASNRSFRYVFAHPKDGLASFEVLGSGRINDDGWILARIRCTAQVSGTESVAETTWFGEEGEWQSLRLQAGDRPLTLSFRAWATQSDFSVRVVSAREDEALEIEDFEPTEAAGDSDDRGEGGDTPLPSLPFIRMGIPVPDALEEVGKLANVQILCDGSASGTVTILCYGLEAPTAGDLIRLIAQSSGLDVFSGSKGLIVGERKAIRGMAFADRPVRRSRALKRVSPEEGAKAVQEAFRELDISGEVVSGPEPGTIQVKAESLGERLFETLSELWANPPMAFDLGCETTLHGETHVEKGRIGIGTPLNRSWKVGTCRVTGVIDPLYSFEDYSLLGAGFRLGFEFPDGGRWEFHGVTRPPGNPPFSFIRCDGVNPLEVRWKGDFIDERSRGGDPPGLAGSGSTTLENAFDSAF